MKNSAWLVVMIVLGLGVLLNAAAPSVVALQDPRGTPLPATWGVSQDSAANSSQTLTKAGAPGFSHYLTLACVGARGAAVTVADVSLQDAAVEFAQFILPAQGGETCMAFTPPYRVGIGNALTVVVPAGGASVVTVGFMAGYTR